jgi:hypothetical protein
LKLKHNTAHAESALPTIVRFLVCGRVELRLNRARSPLAIAAHAEVRPPGIAADTQVRRPAEDQSTSSTTTWISDVEFFGSPATATAARACLPASPKTATNRSLAPLITAGLSANPLTALT